MDDLLLCVTCVFAEIIAAGACVFDENASSYEGVAGSGVVVGDVGVGGSGGGGSSGACGGDVGCGCGGLAGCSCCSRAAPLQLFDVLLLLLRTGRALPFTTCAEKGLSTCTRLATCRIQHPGIWVLSGFRG